MPGPERPGPGSDDCGAVALALVAGSHGTSSSGGPLASRSPNILRNHFSIALSPIAMVKRKGQCHAREGDAHFPFYLRTSADLPPNLSRSIRAGKSDGSSL